MNDYRPVEHTRCTVAHALTPLPPPPSLVGVLPPSLRMLWLGRRNTQRVRRGVIPEGLQALHYTDAEVGQQHEGVELGALPDSIRVLNMHVGDFRILLPPTVLPRNLQWLGVPGALEEHEEWLKAERLLPDNVNIRWMR